MNNVVDGDTWFFVKCIADKGRLGFGKYHGASIKIYATASGGGGKKFTTDCASCVRLEYQDAKNLIKYLKDCHEKSKLVTQNDWGKEGTYIRRNIKTEYGTVVGVTSYWDGKVRLDILNTDKMGVDYMNSANEVGFVLTTEGYNEAITHLEARYAEITEQEKMWELEEQLRKEKERAATRKPPIQSSENKWYISKGMSVEELLKRINNYMINHHGADPGNVEINLEYLPNWEVDGPNIILNKI